MSDQALFLLVEDNADDVMLIRRAFQKSRVLNPLHVARTGEEALAYLSGEGRYCNRAEFPLPALVLLDLKMPGIDGFEVLKWIREQPGLNLLRVVVLTSSDSMRDVNLAYKLGANSFLVKPVDFDRFVEISQALSGYWMWLDRAPDISRPHEQPTARKVHLPQTPPPHSSPHPPARPDALGGIV
jgi:CheY-like chemotaxis protein